MSAENPRLEDFGLDSKELMIEVQRETVGQLIKAEAEIARLRADSINLKTAYSELENADKLITKLRAALEEIASHWDGYVLKDLSAADVMNIARKALANEETK